MQVSLSASGSRESALATIRQQMDGQLADAGEPCRELGARVLEHIEGLTEGKTSVTISASVYVTVSGS